MPDKEKQNRALQKKCRVLPAVLMLKWLQYGVESSEGHIILTDNHIILLRV